MSLGQGSERQTSRAAIGPGPSLGGQAKETPFAAPQKSLVNINENTSGARTTGTGDSAQPAETPGKTGAAELVQCKNGEEITRPNKQTIGWRNDFGEGVFHGALFFPANPC
jgi:hypothetical protein